VALDKSFVGMAFEPFTVEVDKSKIRELAQAKGSFVVALPVRE